jgi:addiction module RelE/StbE family toxin
MKRFRVQWTRRALHDLADIRAFVAADDPRVARRIAQAILKAADRLSIMPRRGRPGRVAGTRELILPGWPWILVYHAAGDRVYVLAVRHSAREK